MPFDVGPQKKISPESVILLRAAEIIKSPRDWNVGQEKARRWWHTRYCAVGSVRRALELYNLCDHDEERVMALLDKVAQAHGFADVATLNDHPDTTHSLVRQVFLEAADLAMVD